MMTTLFHINYDEEEDAVEADFLETDFNFTEELVAGIIATVAYTFSTSVPEGLREQFMARLADLVMQEFRTGELESRAEVTE